MHVYQVLQITASFHTRLLSLNLTFAHVWQVCVYGWGWVSRVVCEYGKRMIGENRNMVGEWMCA